MGKKGRTWRSAARSTFFASPLHADPRSLAAFRVSLGLILAAETLWLLPRAGSLLSNAGVLPLQCLQRSLAPYTQFWSIHRASGGVLVQQILLLAQLAAAGCLIEDAHMFVLTNLGQMGAALGGEQAAQQQ